MFDIPVFPFFDSKAVLNYFKIFELYKKEKDYPLITYSSTNKRYELNTENDFQLSIYAELMEIEENYKDLIFSEQKLVFDYFKDVVDLPAFATTDHMRVRKYLGDWYSAQRTVVTKSRKLTDPYSLTDDELNDLILSFGFPYPYDIAVSQKPEFLHTLIRYYQSKGSPKVLGDVLSFFGVEEFVLCEWWLKYNFQYRNLEMSSVPVYPRTEIDNPDYYNETDYYQFVYSDPYWHYDKPDSSEKVLTLYREKILVGDEFVTANDITLPSITPFISLTSLTYSNNYHAELSIINKKIYDDFEWWVKYVLNKVPNNTTSPSVNDCYLYRGILYVFNEDRVWFNMGFGVPSEWLTSYEQKVTDPLVPESVAIPPFNLYKHILVNIYSNEISFLELFLAFKYLTNCILLQNVVRLYDISGWADGSDPGFTPDQNNTVVYNSTTRTDWLYYNDVWRNLGYRTSYHLDEDSDPPSTSVIFYYPPILPIVDDVPVYPTSVFMYQGVLDDQYEFINSEGNISKTLPELGYRDSIDDYPYEDIVDLYKSMTVDADMTDDDYTNPSYPKTRHCYDPAEGEEYDCRCDTCRREETCQLRLDYYSAREKREHYIDLFNETFRTYDETMIGLFTNIHLNARKLLLLTNSNLLYVIETRLRSLEILYPDDDFEFQRFRYLFTKDYASVLSDAGLTSLITLPNLIYGIFNFKLIKKVINFFKPYRVRFRGFGSSIIFDNRVDDGMYVDESLCNTLKQNQQDLYFITDKITTLAVMNFDDGYMLDGPVLDINYEDVFLTRIEMNYWDIMRTYDQMLQAFYLQFVEDCGPHALDNCRAKDSPFLMEIIAQLPDSGYRLFEGESIPGDTFEINLYDYTELILSLYFWDRHTAYDRVEATFNLLFVEDSGPFGLDSCRADDEITTEIFADSVNGYRYSVFDGEVFPGDLFELNLYDEGDIIVNAYLYDPEVGEYVYAYPFQTIIASLAPVGIEMFEMDTAISIDRMGAADPDEYEAETDPEAIPISNVAQLQLIGNDPEYPLDGSYVLSNDIDASTTKFWNSGEGFIPIGIPDNILDLLSNAFTGTFNGCGYSINGLYQDRSSSVYDFHFTGLFAVNTGTIQNLKINNGVFISNVGGCGLCAGNFTTGIINKCSVNNVLVVQNDPNETVDGSCALVLLNTGTIRNCYSTGEIRGYNYMSGLLGSNIDIGDGGPILVENCYSACTINVTEEEEGEGEYGPPDIVEPIVINSISDLQGIGDYDEYPLDGNYILGGDIDASATATWNGGDGFYPIGTSSSPFTGTFDGGGYTISGLVISRVSMDNVGLFGYTNCAVIRNINLDNTSVLGNNNTGSLVGSNNSSSVVNCSSTNTTAESNHNTCGGLIGYNYRSSVVSSYSSGDVASTYYCGGLIGNSTTECMVSSCYSSCSITAGNGWGHGGLIGHFNGGVVSSCYSTGSVTSAAGYYLGGLIGQFFLETLEDSYSTATVTFTDLGGDGIGGLVGYLLGFSANINRCYSSGLVTPNGCTNYGGLVGYVGSGIVTKSYYDYQSAGVTRGYGTPKTTVEMKQEVTFSDWDFSDIWSIVEGVSYPTLVPYVDIIYISTVEDLQKIGNDPDFPINGYYELNNNIDAIDTISWNLGEGFEPIGVSTTFSGIFDGRGYTISNLVINRSSDSNIGIFGHIDSARLQNIILLNCSFTGYNNVGSICGYAEDSHISGCISESQVTGRDKIGGLVGLVTNTDVSYSQSNSNVTAITGSAGGLVGVSTGTSNLVQSFSNGTTNGINYVGGLAGYVNKTLTEGDISSCYSSVVTTGTNYVGGLIGAILGSNNVSTCYSVGRVSGVTNVGGLIGSKGSGTVTSCYYDTHTSEQDDDSGKGNPKSTELMKHETTFSGWDFTNIWDINEGMIYPQLRIFGELADYYISGFLVTNEGTVTSCYYDVDLAPLYSEYEVATPKYTEDLYNRVTFVNWNFVGIWEIDDKHAYPELYPYGYIIPIYSIQQLQSIGNDPFYPIDALYILMNDIDAYPTRFWNPIEGDGYEYEYITENFEYYFGFRPIGTLVFYDHDDPYGNYYEGEIDTENSTFFSGVLDGNGYSINNLYMMDRDFNALFYGNAGIIRNLTLRNNVHVALTNVSSICLLNAGSIKNCHCVNSQIYGYSFLSGVVHSNMSEIFDCSFKGTISSVNEESDFFGGVSGFALYSIGSNSIIENCSTSVEILSNSSGPVSGFCILSALGEITKSYAYCNFYNNNGYSHDIIADDSSLFSSGFISLAYVCTISECFSYGTIQGNYRLGGFIGLDVSNTITNSFSNCNIISMEPVVSGAMFGGFISYYSFLLPEYGFGTIDNCYSAGFVEDINDVDKYSGGFIGGYDFGDYDYDYSRELVRTSYWDTESSGHTTSSDLGEIGLTTFEMKYSGIYEGWDFDTVWVSHNYNYYPSLRFSRHMLEDYGWFELSSGEIKEMGYLYDFNDDDIIESHSIDIDDHKLCYIFNPCEILKPYVYVNEQSGDAYVGQFLLSYNIDIEDNTGEDLPIIEVVQGVQHYNNEHDNLIIGISTIEELQLIGNHPNYPSDGYYELLNDIDAIDTATWNPDSDLPLVPYRGFLSIDLINGTFDGKGYTISNLHMGRGFDTPTVIETKEQQEDTIEDENINFGIFRIVKNSLITNITLDSCFGFGFHGGLLVNKCVNSIVNNCNSIGEGIDTPFGKASILGFFGSGGLVGFLEDSILKNCFTDHSSLIGYVSLGGLVGTYSNNCSIEESYNLNDLVCFNISGGIVGSSFVSFLAMSELLEIDETTITSDIITIRKCFSESNIVSSPESVVMSAGGLGGILLNATIENCYSIGSIGNEDATWEDYEYGTLDSASSNNGGLVGAGIGGSLSNSYSSGIVSVYSGESSGGLIGLSGEYSVFDIIEVNNSYYDYEISGQDDDDGRGTPLSTLEMQDQNNFIDWDFDTVWTIDGGYPYLYEFIDYDDSYLYVNPPDEYAYGDTLSCHDLSIGYSQELVLGNNVVTNHLINLYGMKYQNYPLCMLRITRNHHSNKIKINSISLKQLIWGDDKVYTVEL